MTEFAFKMTDFGAGHGGAAAAPAGPGAWRALRNPLAGALFLKILDFLLKNR